MVGRTPNKKRISTWIYLFFLLAFLNKIASPEKKDNFKPKYSVKLTCGMGYSAIGDMNKTLESFNNNFIFESARLNTPDHFIDGDIVALENRNLDLEAEFRLHVSHQIALSFATSSPVIKRNESSLTHIYMGSAGDQINNYTFRPKIKTWMPIRLGICYSLFSSPRMNLIFQAGVGYYIAKISEYEELEVGLPLGGTRWETYYWKAHTIEGSGVHSGIVLEFNLTKKLALVGEVEGRYVKLANLFGRMEIEYDWGGGNVIIFEQKGSLYYFTMWDDHIGAYRANLEVWEKPPEGSFREVDNVRKACLDLSGISFRVGIRMRLF